MGRTDDSRERTLTANRARWSLAFLIVLLSVSALADSQADSLKAVDVPAGDLIAALDRLANQIGAEFMYSAAQLKGVRAAGVHGNLTPEGAVMKLLQGTGLTVAARKGDAFLISTERRLTSLPGATGGRDGVSQLEPPVLSPDQRRPAEPGAGRESGAYSSNRLVSAAQAGVSAFPGDDSTLEEIVVTATKRREALSKTGVSVAVATSEQLQERSANSLQDYLAFIPGVAVQSNGTPGFGEVSIRGIAPQSVGATTATYIDGVPFGPTSALTENALFTLDLNPTDLDHVEVLKGPQGTLYGASSMGGLIKYVTRAPDLNTPQYRGMEEYNQSYNGGPGTKVSGLVSLPLIPGELAIGVNGYYVHGGGYVTDLGIGGDDTNRSNNRGFHGSLLYQPLDALTVRLNTMSQDTSVHGQDVVDVNLATGQAQYPGSGGWTQLRYLDEPFRNSVRLYSAEINYRLLDKLNLVSASSYSSLAPWSFRDETSVFRAIGRPYAVFVPPGIAAGGTSSYPSKKVTEELRLEADRMGPVEWTAGFFFQHEDDVDGSSLYQFVEPSLTQLPTDLDFTFRSGTLTEYAGFADLTYYILPSLDISGGFRESRIGQTSFRGAGGELRNPADPSQAITPYQAFSAGSSSYSAGLRWRITDDTLWYLRAASGFRPGGGRSVPFDAPAGYKDYFNADSLWDYETGVKVRSLDGRLTFDADVFWIDWKDIQALVPLPGALGLNDGNGGTALSRGAEAEVKYIPVTGLTVGANGALTEAKFTQTVLPVATNGEPLFYVPKFTATAFADVSKPIGGGWNGYFGADYQYTDERLDLNRTQLPAYSIWNLHTGVRDVHYRVNLYVNNIANKQAYLGYAAGGYGAPYGFAVNQSRTVGIALSQQF
jgi:iron complex outermembrane recepter protein